MGHYYQIKQGDHLSKIAAHFGFLDYQLIWNHPQNANLKTKRQNPNVLLPGDCLYIPDRQQKETGRSTGQTHCFQIKRCVLRLQILAEEAYHTPLADRPYSLTLGGKPSSKITSGIGLLTEAIPVDAEEVLLRLEDREIPVKIGHLDPVDTESGQTARLTNLGYYWGDPENRETEAFLSAVEEFQCDHQLQVDGKCGPKTQNRLKQIHGC